VVIAVSGTIFKNMGLSYHLLAFLYGGVLVLSALQLGTQVYLGGKPNGQHSLSGIVFTGS
jgi:hypothetical protein